MPTFDAHAFYVETPLSQASASRDAILETMQRSQIDGVALISGLAASCDFITGNRRLREILDASAGLFGWVTLNADYPNESQDEQRRHMMRPEFVGGVLFGYNGNPVTADSAREVLNAQRRFTKPIAIHTPDAEAVRAARAIAEEFPSMKFLLLTMGGEDWRLAVAAAKRYLNLYLEISGSLDADKVAHAAATLTPRKLIYGSGLPHRDPELALALVAEADGLTGFDRTRILSQNAQALFNAPLNAE
jgi:predicted TIM-barrel fold metal-dependent hydrolase